MEIHGMGGCGQTAIMKSYGDKISNHCHDHDGRKHAPKDICPAQPSLYVYCHPELSASSHYRRKWAEKASKKLNPHGAGVPKTLDGYLQTVCTDTSGQDGFGFLDNFLGWNSCETVLPVTVEDFHDPLKTATISKFTGIDAPSDFIKERRSKVTSSCLDNVWKIMKSEAAKKFANT